MSEPSDFTRVPARWRIVGWLLFTAAIGLVALIVTVNSALQAQAAQQSNDDVAQELHEFSDFVAPGIDPDTGAAFTSVDRLLEAYLDRQTPTVNEAIYGLDDQDNVVAGVAGSEAIGKITLDGENTLLAKLSSGESGIADTNAGEVRWGILDVTSPDGGKGRLLVVNITENGYRTVAKVTRTMSWVAVGVLLLTAVISWLVAGRILAPLRHMRRTAARIAGGELSRRFRVEGQDDLAVLALTLNEMLDRLEDGAPTPKRGSEAQP